VIGTADTIDAQGFRANVGIILLNNEGHVFWARRMGMAAWQFPQGGINPYETPEHAMFRELREEIGLEPQHVQILGSTSRWLRYRLPKHFVRHHQKPLCIGQKQIWYILRLAAEESHVHLDLSKKPEFSDWRWVNYWRPLTDVVFFKRDVYRRALMELAPFRASLFVDREAEAPLDILAPHPAPHDSRRPLRGTRRHQGGQGKIIGTAPSQRSAPETAPPCGEGDDSGGQHPIPSGPLLPAPSRGR
jgi:putative (di)nucleoside polyphosphate hydrolase